MSSTDIPQQPTLRQLYDFVVERIVEQGRASVDGAGCCLYRGPNSTKCAVGHVIADAHYHPDLEDQDLSYMVVKVVARSLGFGGLPEAYIHLLDRLQAAHDIAADRGLGSGHFVDRFRANLPPRPQE